MLCNHLIYCVYLNQSGPPPLSSPVPMSLHLAVSSPCLISQLPPSLLSLAAAELTATAPPDAPSLSASLTLSVYLPPASIRLSIHPPLPSPSPPPSRCGHAPGDPEMRLRNVSFLTVLLFGLCGLVSLSWYTAFSSSRGKTRSRCVPV